MAKVTSKLQITLPKALATQYGIEPGDEIHFAAAGDAIRLSPQKAPRPRLSFAERLRIWDQANQALRAHWQSAGKDCVSSTESTELVQSAQAARGWTREELYDRVTRYTERSASNQPAGNDGNDEGSEP